MIRDSRAYLWPFACGAVGGCIIAYAWLGYLPLLAAAPALVNLPALWYAVRVSPGPRERTDDLDGRLRGEVPRRQADDHGALSHSP